MTGNHLGGLRALPQQHCHLPSCHPWPSMNAYRPPPPPAGASLAKRLNDVYFTLFQMILDGKIGTAALVRHRRGSAAGLPACQGFDGVTCGALAATSHSPPTHPSLRAGLLPPPPSSSTPPPAAVQAAAGQGGGRGLTAQAWRGGQGTGG